MISRNFLIGPELPFDIWGHSMVTSPNGKGVIIIGGKIESQGIYSKAILELNSPYGTWKILHKKLLRGRHNHLAFAINEKVLENLI